MRLIRRVAYTRRKTGRTPRRVYVPSSMIRNLGRPGHGPKVLPTPKAGLLTMWGYSTAASPPARHRALLNAINKGHQRPASVLRHLQLVETYTKRSQKRASSTYRGDRLWLRARAI